MLREQSIKKMTLSRPLDKKEDPFSSSSSSSASASVQAVPQFHPELLEVVPAWKALLNAILLNSRVGCERVVAIKFAFVWEDGRRGRDVRMSICSQLNCNIYKDCSANYGYNGMNGSLYEDTKEVTCAYSTHAPHFQLAI